MRQLRIRKGALAHVDVAAQGYALQRRALERARADDGHVLEIDRVQHRARERARTDDGRVLEIGRAQLRARERAFPRFRSRPRPAPASVPPLPSNICAGIAPVSTSHRPIRAGWRIRPAGMSAGSHLMTSFFQPGQPIQRALPDLGQGFGQGQRLQLRAARERPRADGGHGIETDPRRFAGALSMKASAPMVVNASLCETEKYSMVWLPLNTPSPSPTTSSP